EARAGIRMAGLRERRAPADAADAIDGRFDAASGGNGAGAPRPDGALHAAARGGNECRRARPHDALRGPRREPARDRRRRVSRAAAAHGWRRSSDPLMDRPGDVLALLGRNLAEPEVAKRLADYPGLRPEEGGALPDERVPAVKYLRSAADGLLVKLSEDGEIL